MAGLPIEPRSPLSRPDEPVDVVAELAVLLDPLARRGGDLHEHGVVDRHLAVADQLAERAEPVEDALGVVEPVDAEQHPARVAELLADLAGPLLDRLGAGQRVQARGVDGDRERPGLHDPAVGQVDQVAVGLVADPLADQPDEVLRGTGPLEADDVGAEQALEQLAPPGQLLEQLGRRERDVQEEADPQVGAQLAQHRRHQLHLVVVHPDRGVLGGDLGGLLGEPPVDPDVGVPPLAVELRLGDHVVVERPEGGVGEALVELLDLRAAQRHRHQRQAVVDEGLHVVVAAARPADPGAVVLAHHRLDGGDQAAGGAAPVHRPVVVDHPVDGQPVGDDDQVGLAGLGRSGGAHASNLPTRGDRHERLA